MSAAERRRALTAAGESLLARNGGPGERRGAALLSRLAGVEPPGLSFEDLDHIPVWLRLPRAARERIAVRAALLSAAPALAGTIDGSLLGTHARAAGEEAMDWAIARADRVPDGGLLPVEAADLDRRGLALMRAALPDRLRGLLGPIGEAIQPDPALAALCVAEAVRDGETI